MNSHNFVVDLFKANEATLLTRKDFTHSLKYNIDSKLSRFIYFEINKQIDVTMFKFFIIGSH